MQVAGWRMAAVFSGESRAQGLGWTQEYDEEWDDLLDATPEIVPPSALVRP